MAAAGRREMQGEEGDLDRGEFLFRSMLISMILCQPLI